MVNVAVPGTIDERVIRPRPRKQQDMDENHKLCANSAIGKI